MANAFRNRLIGADRIVPGEGKKWSGKTSRRHLSGNGSEVREPGLPRAMQKVQQGQRAWGRNQRHMSKEEKWGQRRRSELRGMREERQRRVAWGTGVRWTGWAVWRRWWTQRGQQLVWSGLRLGWGQHEEKEMKCELVPEIQLWRGEGKKVAGDGGCGIKRGFVVVVLWREMNFHFHLPQVSPVYCTGLPICLPDLSFSPLQRMSFSRGADAAALQHSQDKGRMRSLLAHLPSDSLTRTWCSRQITWLSLPRISPAFSHLFCFCSGLSKIWNTCPFLCILLLFQDQLKCQLCSETSLMLSQPPLSHTACVIHYHIALCIKTVMYMDSFPMCLCEPQRRALG